MSWIKIQFQVKKEVVESLSDVLEAFLAQAITTENAGENEFYEIAFPGTPDWEFVALSALFNDNVDVEPIIEFVKQHFSNGNELPVTIEKLVDQDWNKVWLASFKPIQVGHNLWVCPSWCEATEPNARNIILDPGLAFGTGTHDTTHMCLQWLSEQSFDGKTILDYGSGTGILALAALMSGASSAVAVDIDPLAVNACKDNANKNNLSDQLVSLLPNELELSPYDKTQYDIVIANILADVIIGLKDTLLSHLAENGLLLLTGILDTQADKVIAHYNEVTFTKIEQNGWSLLIGA